MAKSLKEFGGWLRFFQVTLIIGLIVSILVIVFSAMALSKGKADFSTKHLSLYSLSIALIIAQIFCIFKILKMMSISTLQIPDQLYYYMKVLLVIALISLGGHVLIRLFNDESVFGGPNSNYIFDSIRGIVITFIWMRYLARSKRVKAFYGKNATVAEQS
ncbi:MAG: hypothetical protein GY754_27380 [bacterium]|nr:hypothetical protein [bacterium]